MKNLNSGVFITKLSVIGPGVPNAELEFVDGLNVVSGASDTGKSFAFSCIDFAFGAGSSPRSIPQASGYEAVRLYFTARETAENFIIERPFRGRRVQFIRIVDGAEVEEITIPAQHSAKDQDTLSGILLNFSGLWGVQVRKNAKGVRRSLSFRDVAHLCLIDEERIIAERPPHLSGQYTTPTVEREVLEVLLTGNESGSETFDVPKSEGSMSINAKIELVDQMVLREESQLYAKGMDDMQLTTELAEIEEAWQRASIGYEDARESLVDLEVELGDLDSELRKIKGREAVVHGLLNRFKLLSDHYDSNIDRLSLISETGSLLTALPSENCPLCGSAPESHQIAHQDEGREPDRVRIAAEREAHKFETLRADLQNLIRDLELENSELRASEGRTSVNLQGVQKRIEVELQPRIKVSADVIFSKNQRRDALLQAKLILENISKLKKVAQELADARDAAKSEAPLIGETASATQMDEFAVIVGEILTAWNYPDPGDVYFSAESQDLLIGEHGRSSHGKGVRALTCAAFIVGIMKHCQKLELPHPSLVLLDSPLVAYKEPDSAEGKILEKAGVKDEFYHSFSNGVVSGQVIIFENEHPPDDLPDDVIKHRFTKSDTGRYGFFPRIP